MASPSTKAGHFLADILGIKLQNPEPFQDEVTRGESVLSMQTSDTFVEEEPSTGKFLEQLLPSRPQFVEYLWSLFPFLSWIGHYNLQWLAGDLVAGELPLLPFHSIGRH